MITAIKVFLFPTMLLFLISCLGPSSSNENNLREPNQNEVVREDGSNVQGIYAAIITPVNYNLHFKKLGSVALQRNDDDFKTDIFFEYGPKRTRVIQALYTGRRCPDLNDDLNKDAYIDIIEAKLAIGEILIPFDNDIESQLGGEGLYPTVSEDGKMLYSQLARFSALFSDLKAFDPDSEDNIVKLQESEGLTLAGKIVLFQGIPKEVFLPDSVKTINGEEPHSTLPSACAVLRKVKDMPEDILGPISAP